MLVPHIQKFLVLEHFFKKTENISRKSCPLITQLDIQVRSFSLLTKNDCLAYPY